MRLISASLLTLVLFSPIAHASEGPTSSPEPSGASELEPASKTATPAEALSKEDSKQQLRSKVGKLPRGAADSDESSLIRARGLHQLYRLTYPTGRMPSQPWARAMEHVRANVATAEPWGLDGRQPFRGLPEGATAPGTNLWTPFGPEPLDAIGTGVNLQYQPTSGRATDIVVAGTECRRQKAAYTAASLTCDSDDSQVMWATFPAGGLWRSLDAGATWVAMWEDLDFVTQAAGTIEIDFVSDSTGATVFVGTGDWQANDQFGSGILYTENALASPESVAWTQLGADVFTPYSSHSGIANDSASSCGEGGNPACTHNRWNNQNIHQIRVDPNNPDTLLVGTRYNLYMSPDRGATWSLCRVATTGTFINPDAGIGAASGDIERISGIFLDGRAAGAGSSLAYVGVGYLINGSSFAAGSNGVYRFAVASDGSCPTFPAGITDVSSGLPTARGRTEFAQGTVDGSQALLLAQIEDADSLDNEGIWKVDLGTSATGDDGSWSFVTGSDVLGGFACGGGDAGSDQDWYDLFLTLDPTSDDRAMAGHISMYEVDLSSGSAVYDDLGEVYARVGSPPPGCQYGQLHPDQHAGDWSRVFLNPGERFDPVVVNDGGIFRWDGVGAAWDQLNETLSTNQFYAGQLGADFAGAGGEADGRQWIQGGMQDNGCATWNDLNGPAPVTTSDLEWTTRANCGDGMWAAFDSWGGTESQGVWIFESQNGNLTCGENGAGGSFSIAFCGLGGTNFFAGGPDWSTPIVMDQLHCTRSGPGATSGNCSITATASSTVVVSTQVGDPNFDDVSPSLTSGGAVVSLSWSPSEPGTLAAGTDDGRWWVSFDVATGPGCTRALANTESFACTPNGAAQWREITNAILPNRVVAGVAFDAADANVLYAAFHGFDENTPSEPGHVFRAVHQGGGVFTVADKTGNLPNVPTLTLLSNPYKPEQVFVGTYKGFYYTNDISADQPVWYRYMDGLPNTIVQHLVVDRGPESSPYDSTTLGAFTYGRGFYAVQLPFANGTWGTDTVFMDGFESGDTSFWTNASN